MRLRIVALITIIAILNLTYGCTVTSKETILTEDLPRFAGYAIIAAVLSSGERVAFADPGAAYDGKHQSLVGLDLRNTPRTIPIDDVLHVTVEKNNVGASAVLTVLVVAVGLVAAFFLILAASSCPFVYSFDGERFVFDAEPLGGAVSRGLAKSDWSRLERLVPRDGFYELLVRNEMDETQHLDEMRLLVADHPTGTTIYPDLDGRLHAVRDIQPPLKAVDERGNDLLPFVRAADDIVWQTKLPTDSTYQETDARHHLSFTFARPAGASRAALLVNAGTAGWGSQMIRSMLMLRGDRVDDWYANVDAGGGELFKLGLFVLREELFVLKIKVREGDTWVQRGLIPGSGPYMTEDRLCELDLSNVTGDKVEIRLDPPMGYWVIGHLGMSFDTDGAVESHLVTATEMRDQMGQDITPLLSLRDELVHDMPETGQWYTARYPVPPGRPGRTRSVFLQTSGWYEIHLAKDQPEQTALIEELMNTPGRIARWSMEEFLNWRTRHVAAQQ